jgi:hypothetical protein
MKTAIATLRSIAPYSQSRAHETEKLPREAPDAYEQRTWRERCHYRKEDNRVFIPPHAFKQALDRAAKMLGRQIPGKGKSTFTKFFESGVLCADPIVLPITKDEAAAVRIHANADGVRGSGKRVWRTYPVIEEWEGRMSFIVLADEITEDVFADHLKQAGQFVGIGRFRPEKGGWNGRFEVIKIDWA